MIRRPSGKGLIAETEDLLHAFSLSETGNS